MAEARQRAFVALGSNLGDSEAILRSAIAALGELPGTNLVAHSSLIRTAPVGGPSKQPDFLNGAVELHTELAPLELLHRLQEIETGHGRDRNAEERWGPRLLDLDLLVMEARVVDSEELELPHPRMELRAFVLEPLAELCPDLVLPKCKQTVSQRCDALRAEVNP